MDKRCNSVLQITPEKDPAALAAPLLLMGPLALVLIPVPCKHGSIVKQDDFLLGVGKEDMTGAQVPSRNVWREEILCCAHGKLAEP